MGKTVRMVFVGPDGRVVRKREAQPDPALVPAREKKRYRKERKRYKRSRMSVPEVVSMWINPHSLMVPAEERRRQMESINENAVVNVKHFLELEDALSLAEKELRSGLGHGQIGTNENTSYARDSEKHAH